MICLLKISYFRKIQIHNSKELYNFNTKAILLYKFYLCFWKYRGYYLKQKKIRFTFIICQNRKFKVHNQN